MEGHVDISTSPSLYNYEELVAIVLPEPFENYFSEGSVSISTCDFVDVDSASTDKPNASEYIGL